MDGFAWARLERLPFPVVLAPEPLLVTVVPPPETTAPPLTLTPVVPLPLLLLPPLPALPLPPLLPLPLFPPKMPAVVLAIPILPLPSRGEALLTLDSIGLPRRVIALASTGGGGPKTLTNEETPLLPAPATFPEAGAAAEAAEAAAAAAVKAAMPEGAGLEDGDPGESGPPPVTSIGELVPSE